jgi:hypothetical protein
MKSAWLSHPDCIDATTPRCAITVAEYETCMAETVAMLELRAASTPSCEDRACSSFHEVARLEHAPLIELTCE